MSVKTGYQGTSGLGHTDRKITRSVQEVGGTPEKTKGSDTNRGNSGRSVHRRLRTPLTRGKGTGVTHGAPSPTQVGKGPERSRYPYLPSVIHEFWTLVITLLLTKRDSVVVWGQSPCPVETVDPCPDTSPYRPTSGCHELNPIAGEAIPGLGGWTGTWSYPDTTRSNEGLSHVVLLLRLVTPCSTNVRSTPEERGHWVYVPVSM